MKMDCRIGAGLGGRLVLWLSAVDADGGRSNDWYDSHGDCDFGIWTKRWLWVAVLLDSLRQRRGSLYRRPVAICSSWWS